MAKTGRPVGFSRVQGAGAVAFDGQDVLAVHNIDSIRWRIGARVRSAARLVFAPRAQDLGAELGHFGGPSPRKAGQQPWQSATRMHYRPSGGASEREHAVRLRGGRLGRSLPLPSPFVVLSRSSRAVRTVARHADVARELGLRATQRYLAGERDARAWTAAARRAVYADIWSEAARLNEARHSEFGDDFALFEKDGASTIAWFHNVQLDDAVTLRLALDKGLVHRRLTDAGVVVPEHRVFSPADPSNGFSFLREGDGHYVVKPAAGTSGGSGVTCAVASVADFRRAMLHAARSGERLMIERSIPGDEYRFLFLDGKLLDVIRRRRPHVVGDGRSTVAELMHRDNELRAAGAPEAGIAFLYTDLDCVLTLNLAGHTLRSVPPAGETVVVKSTANLNAAWDNVTVDRAQVSDALVEEARRAAAAARLRLAGVDLITPDIGRPLAEAGGAVIEVNGTPGFHYHYLVADPDRATRIAVPVLRTLLEDAPWRDRWIDRGSTSWDPAA